MIITSCSINNFSISRHSERAVREALSGVVSTYFSFTSGFQMLEFKAILNSSLHTFLMLTSLNGVLFGDVSDQSTRVSLKVQTHTHTHTSTQYYSIKDAFCKNSPMKTFPRTLQLFATMFQCSGQTRRSSVVEIRITHTYCANTRLNIVGVFLSYTPCGSQWYYTRAQSARVLASGDLSAAQTHVSLTLEGLKVVSAARLFHMKYL